VGVSVSLLIFSSLVTFGHLVFCLGIFCQSWGLMFLGRFLFGCGGESFVVANTTFISQWFEGKELALAFGVSMAGSKLGSVWNNITSPVLLRHFNSINIPFLFGFLLCIICNLLVLLTNWIEKNTTASMAPQQEGNYQELSISSSHGKQYSGEDVSVCGVDNESAGKTIVQMKTISTYTTLVGGTSYGGYDKEVNDSARVPPADDGGGEENGSDPDQRSIRFSEIFHLPIDFWICMLICFICYGVVFPFNNISASLLMERDYFKPLPSSCHLIDRHQCHHSVYNYPVDCPAGHGYQVPLPVNYSSFNPFYPTDIDCSDVFWSKNPCTEEYCHRFNTGMWYADSAMSIPYAITAITSPLFGYIIDNFGYRGKLNVLFSSILVVVHYLLASTRITPIVPLLGQGCAYSIFSAVLWSSIPLIVMKRVLGFSFGITTCAQNLGTALFPLVIAMVYDFSDDLYIPNVEYLFMIMSCLGLIGCLLLNYYDYHYGGRKFE
jgi:MFS family permease